MELVGYAEIKRDASTGLSAVSLDLFKGKVVRVMEFSQDGGALVIDPGATGLATFDSVDIVRKFRCSESGEYLIPPDLNFLEQAMYITRLTTRKGGWDPILKKMLIGASLHRGEFNDTFLFQNQ
jgi:hypothetical protein